MKRMLCALLAAAILSSFFIFAGCSGDTGARDVYNMRLSYEGGVLSGEMDFTYHNDTGETLGYLEFNLFGNAYREDAVYKPVSAAFSASAYYAGESFGGMEISSVSPCSAWSVGGEDENILSVELAEPLEDGGQASVCIAWTLTLAQVEHRTGIAEHSVNLGNFYPIACVYEDGAFRECEYYSDGDPFYSECADYCVTLETDADYTVASSGQILSAEVKGSKKTYQMQLSDARDFAIVLSGEYSVAQGEACGVQVMYYYYDDAEPQKKLDLLEESLTYFSQTFGDYMYPAFSAVQTGFAVGGMEYPALVMIGDHLSGTDAFYTAVHETAHQWWYAAVGSDQLEKAWLDEGLAEFSSALFFGAHGDYGMTYQGLKEGAERAYRAFYTVHSQIFGEADTAMNKKLGEYLSEYQYVVLAYDKGLLLFDTLRDTFGENKVLAGLKRYYREYSGKIAGQADLSACLKKAGADGGGIIDSFADGTAVI